MNVTVEKRQHRRLETQMPLEFYRLGLGRCTVNRTKTINVSTGGVYFETMSGDISPGDCLALELEVESRDNRFPRNSKISTIAEVVRTITRQNKTENDGPSFTLHGIGARFIEAIKLKF